MTRLVFVDTETTGLDDRRHEIWEVGLIVRAEGSSDIEFVWQLPVDLTEADPIALNIGRYYDRRWSSMDDFNDLQDIEDALSGEVFINGYIIPPSSMSDWAALFVKLTRGAHLIGNVTSFDEERLRKLLRRYRQCPMWHYHIVCVENLIAGKLGIQPPWKSKDLSEAIGISVPEDQHSALADARWAKDMYDEVYNLNQEKKYNEKRI